MLRTRRFKHSIVHLALSMPVFGPFSDQFYDSNCAFEVANCLVDVQNRSLAISCASFDLHEVESRAVQRIGRSFKCTIRSFKRFILPCVRFVPGTLPSARLIRKTSGAREPPHQAPYAALGSEFRRGPTTFNVVGIVGDVRYESVNAEVRPTAYISALQFTRSRLSFVMKTRVNPESLFPQLRDAVWSIAADAPITRTTTISALVSESAREERFRTVVIVLFSICAALLAASGIFGVTARSAARRYREFGIR